jgi:hypothetical protein
VAPHVPRCLGVLAGDVDAEKDEDVRARIEVSRGDPEICRDKAEACEWQRGERRLSFHLSFGAPSTCPIAQGCISSQSVN